MTEQERSEALAACERDYERSTHAHARRHYGDMLKEAQRDRDGDK
jgi:hypothetical protein